MEEIKNVSKFNIKDCKEFVKERNKDSNKGDYGYIGILGGCDMYSGAIKLANLSAASIRSGSGVTRLIIPKSIEQSIMPYLLEATIFPLENYNSHIIFSPYNIDKALNKIKALAIGMGWGENENNVEILKYILNNYSIPLVIDADGLNTLSKMDDEILINTKCKVILTPHLKEFERLSKINFEDIKKNAIKFAKKYAKEHKVILLLKGHTTIVTDAIDTYLINKGGAGMATAGSGDVLSGIIVGMLGSFEPTVKLISACAYINGLAGEIAERTYTDIAMRAHDTIECIPEAIKAIRKA